MLLDAVPRVLAAVPGARFLVAGRGETGPDEVRELLGEKAAGAVEFLGGISDEEKARLLSSVDIYCAPQTGGESFGIVLVEAMSAGAAVVASDLGAFSRVLDDGAAGVLFRAGDSDGPRADAVRVLHDPALRASVTAHALEAVPQYDWSVVTDQVLDRVRDGRRGPPRARRRGPVSVAARGCAAARAGVRPDELVGALRLHHDRPRRSPCGGSGSRRRAWTGCTARSRRRKAVVDAQLVRRATVAAELATSGLFDPVSSVLVGEAAWAALSAGGPDVTEEARCPPTCAGCCRRTAARCPASTATGARASGARRPRTDRERAVGDAARGARRPGRGGRAARRPGGRRARRRARRRPGTGCSSPAGSTTRRSRRPPAHGADRWSGCCGWPATRRCPHSLELDDTWPENLGRPGRAAARGARRPS